MKKTITAVAAALTLSASISFSQSVIINFGAGTLYASTNTSTTMVTGARLNLLSLNTGTWEGLGDLTTLFSGLTNSWTPAGTTLVGAIANNNDGSPGLVSGSFGFDYSGAFGVNDELLLVAYPTLTLASTSPGLNTPGFFFRAKGTNLFDGSTIAWLAPDPGVSTLGAYSADNGGSFVNGQFTSGAGSQAVTDANALGGGFTTVPEPSTYALLAMGAAALGGYVIRLRKRD